MNQSIIKYLSKQSVTL